MRPNHALPPRKTAGKQADGMSLPQRRRAGMVRNIPPKNSGMQKVHMADGVFFIQFIVLLTLILINLVINMNLWHKAPCRRWR
jgi:hypothetical protein